VIATAVAVLGGVLVPLQYGQVACCGVPQPSSPSTQGGQKTAAPASTTEVALLFYYFQLNGTTGTLLAVLQNIGTLNTSISNVYFDNSPFQSSSMTLDGVCANLLIGRECRMTLAFGPGSVLPPAQGSVHSLAIETASGDRFDYRVAAGAGGADCGLAHC